MIFNLTDLHDNESRSWVLLVSTCGLTFGNPVVEKQMSFDDVYFICDLWKPIVVCVYVCVCVCVTLTLACQTAQKWLWQPCWLSCMIPNQDFILSRRDGIAWLGNPIFVSSSDTPEYSVWMRHALSLFSSSLLVLINKAAAMGVRKQDILLRRWAESGVKNQKRLYVISIHKLVNTFLIKGRLDCGIHEYAIKH